MDKEKYEKMQLDIYNQVEKLKMDLNDPSKKRINPEYVNMSFVKDLTTEKEES